MSSGEARRLSSQDLQTVQNLIERCIQLHMSRTDAVNVLLREAKIQPSITELVWQRLEEENPEFFEAYHIRLALNDQIKLFNELLKQQAALMGQMQSTGAISMPASNGCQMTQFQQNASCYAIDHTRLSTRPESLQATMPHSIPFTNGASTLQTPATFNSSSASRNDFLPNLLHDRSSNSMRMMQGLNGGIPRKESGYSSDSQIIFNADANANVIAPHPPMENATFNHLDASSEPLNEALLGIDATSFGQLEQLAKNFSFPDLAAFPNLDLLENFPSSEFSTDADNFLGSQDRGETTEEHKLDTLSDSYSIEGFGVRE